ncbi:hypothetical protein MUK42_37671 [Musa troglodytarum]|uniref:Uncharacterized protein n=1 Tax=Musa troglodytarum TaxID=320322 RepID=A0A9E7HLG0_9LILI|nr:hypothetical protein MUK42_37671 [Musa troglodytarum]
MVNRAKWSKLDHCPKQPQVGYMCKLTHLLPELLKMSTTVNMMSKKLVTHHERRRRILECQPGKRAIKRDSQRETYLDVLEASLEELYQGQRRLLEVESSQEEVESRIDKVKALVNRLMDDTKDSMQHLQEVVAERTSGVTFLTRVLNVRGSNTRIVPPQSLRVPEPHCYGGIRDVKELENFLFDMEQYFRAMRPNSEDTKVSIATMIFVDIGELCDQLSPSLGIGSQTSYARW